MSKETSQTPAPPSEPITNDRDRNLAIWNHWSNTDPDRTKEVREGSYKYTAIAAYWQFMKATELFGPVGQGWGWKINKWEILFPEKSAHSLLLYDIEVWCGDATESIRLLNTIKLFNKDGTVIDDDAFKKLLTDSITKGLSYYGCAADVFMGMYDDHRYVERARARAAEERKAEGQPPAQAAPPARQTTPATRPPAQSATRPPTRQPANQATTTPPAAPNAPTGQNQAPTAQNSTGPRDSVRSPIFAKCRAHCEAMGIELSRLQAILKENGYGNLQEVPVPYLENVEKILRARTAAYKSLIDAATKAFGDDDGIERVYIWLDQNQIDLLTVDPNVLLDGVKKVCA